jgi:hypothetical protein
MHSRPPVPYEESLAVGIAGLDLLVIRGQPALEQLAALTIQTTRNHRSCVHIQPNTRTLILLTGASHILWLYRPGPPCREPTFTCERRPQPLHTV